MQGGILAAAGLLALDRAPVTIARDHRMAAVLADGVDGLGDARVKVQRPVETNIVMLRTNNLDAQVLANALQVWCLQLASHLVWYHFLMSGSYCRMKAMKVLLCFAFHTRPIKFAGWCTTRSRKNKSLLPLPSFSPF